MNNSLISIIIPAYNVESCIKKTLDSVFAQTYNNIEVIAVDDGSKDDTASILDDYAQNEHRLKVFHKENGGVTSARLFGAEKALGEYIGFVDGDDLLEPDMYELLLNNAKKHQADISHCGYQMVFPSRVDLYYGTGKIIEQDNVEGIKDLIDGIFVEPGLVNKLYRKALFDGLTEKIDLSVKINEDLLMNFYLFEKSSKSVFEDKCKYLYIVRSGSAANSKINEHIINDPIKVGKIIYEKCKNNPNLKKSASRMFANKLIGPATMSVKANPELLKKAKRNAHRMLKEYFKELIFGQSKSQIIKVCWATFSPTTYSLVHKLYSKLNGNDKKYDIS